MPEVRILRDCLLRTGETDGEREKLTLEAPSESRTSPVGTVALLGLVALLGVTIVLIAFSFPAGIYSVFSGNLSQNITYSTLIRPYFWIGPSVALAPFVVSAGAWFAIFTAVYMLFFLYALRQKEHFWSAIRSAFRTGFDALMSSPFIVVIVSIGFLNFTSSIIDVLVTSTGAPIGGPTGDPLALLLGFTFAPLVEEVGFRVILIGTVAFILSFGRPWRTALSAFWRPSRAIEGVAVGSGASLIIWAATSFSAVTFGACHVFCGSSWDLGKLPEAIYGGFVLGYLYVRYGLHVAVLAHWGVDFFGSVYAFFGQAAYGIPWDSATKEYVGQYLVDVDLLFFFGLASFLLIVYLGLKKLARRSGGAVGDFKAPAAGGGVEA
jgi:hypothetical protein